MEKQNFICMYTRKKQHDFLINPMTLLVFPPRTATQINLNENELGPYPILFRQKFRGAVGTNYKIMMIIMMMMMLLGCQVNK